MRRLLVPLLLAAGLGSALGCAHSAETPQAAAAKVDAPAPQPAEKTRALGVALEHFDRSVRPQDDLYRYVNGTWLKTAQIPADRARWGTFIELAERSELALKDIIEEVAAAEASAGAGTEPSSERRKIGELFASFMDTARIEQLGASPVEPLLKRIAAFKDRKELPVLLAELQRDGVQTPVNLYVWQDAKQATRYIAYLNQSGLGLPDRDYYLKEEPRFVAFREAYAKYIETLFTLAKQPDPKGAAKAVLALEHQLARAQWDRVKNRDREATYNLHTAAELDAKTPGFSWTRFLQTARADASPGIVVRQPDYVVAMSAALARAPVKQVRQYLTFKVLDGAAPFLSSPFETAWFELHEKTLQGVETPRPRWKRGVATVETALGEAVGKLYVERHFKPEARARMQALVDNLTAAFREGIDGLEWMSPATRAQAHAKLSKFRVKIGYPTVWRDYGKLEIARDDLLGNVRRAAAFEFDRGVERLGKPIDREEWSMTPQRVNAYYSSTMNEIVFPAAILQPPFFDPDADDAVNYGAIGGVIGHEISHGFDDQGSRSDGEGNLREWWSPEDKAAFVARTARLAAQYDTFRPLEGMSINGKLSLGENIGDLSGLTVAYRAWQKSLQGKPAPVIDGFSGPQRFFLGWAQIWRTLYREDALRQQLVTGPHAPGEFRVLGVVRNMPAFYEAFGVKEGDAAYLPPEERVKVW